jgi:hypothetical protein
VSSKDGLCQIMYLGRDGALGNEFRPGNKHDSEEHGTG